MRPTCYIHKDGAGHYHIQHDGTVWSSWDDPADVMGAAYGLVREKGEGGPEADARPAEDVTEITDGPGVEHTGVFLSSDGVIMGDVRISIDPNRSVFYVIRGDARIGPIDDEETAWYVAGAWHGSPEADTEEIESLAQEALFRKR